MSQSQSQKSKTKVITGIVRLSYAHIWEPTAGMEPGSGLKYSCALLIPKTDNPKSKNRLIFFMYQ